MSRVYMIPLQLSQTVTAATLESMGASRSVSSPVPIINIMPKSRMNQLVSTELQSHGWKPGDDTWILSRRDSFIDLVLDLETRSLVATVDVQKAVEQRLGRTRLEDNAKNRQLIADIMDGTVDPVTGLLGTHFLPEINSAIQKALQDATSKINQNLAGAYRNAMVERATALGRIAKVDETRTNEGLRVRITVQSE